MSNPKPMNILLVDDDIIDVESIKRIFLNSGITHSIIVAYDGIQALCMLRSGEVPRPRIILLDLNMPKMNGIDFLKEIRSDQQLKYSIVFVLTTSNAEKDRLAAYDFNVAGYFTKDKIVKNSLKLVKMLEFYWNIVEMPLGDKNAEPSKNSVS
ncbi:MAG: response regulator [bacterium]